MRSSQLIIWLCLLSGMPAPSLSFTPNTAKKNSVPDAFPVRTPESNGLTLSTMQSIDDLSLLDPWESWCVSNVESWYQKALDIKCPFFRRRASDMLDAVDQVLRFIIIRHKSLDVLGPPAGWRCEGDTCDKVLNLEVAELTEILQEDWRTDTNKGYYITGKISTSVYRDDCLFEGPDPDMPVRGLRKYLNAASQLFDQRQSCAQLLSLEAMDEYTIVATWEMNGILRLPWRPELPRWTGTTTYHRDDLGLIYKHTETWDVSVFQAFMRTFLPQVAGRIYGISAIR